MNDRLALRLLEPWRQCQLHMDHLDYALAALAPLLRATATSLSYMDDEVDQDCDQFILRFSKLQDVMSAQLYPALLGYLREPYEDRPMLDKLHRLESLAFLNQAVAAVGVLESLLGRVTNVGGKAR